MPGIPPLRHFCLVLIYLGAISLAGVNTGLNGLAGRYASALLDIADDKSALDAVAEDLKGLEAAIEENADLRQLLESPRYSHAEQAKALSEMLDKFGVHEITRNFVLVVSENRRLAALSDIAKTFLVELSRRRGEVRATVTAAHELTTAQQEAVANALVGKFGNKVKVDVTVDESLIGGMIVQIGSQMFDSSVRTKLQRLELVMKGVG